MTIDERKDKRVSSKVEGRRRRVETNETNLINESSSIGREIDNGLLRDLPDGLVDGPGEEGKEAK